MLLLEYMCYMYRARAGAHTHTHMQRNEPMEANDKKKISGYIWSVGRHTHGRHKRVEIADEDLKVGAVSAGCVWGGGVCITVYI